MENTMSPLTNWKGVSDKGIEVLVGEMEGSDLIPQQRGEPLKVVSDNRLP